MRLGGDGGVRDGPAGLPGDLRRVLGAPAVLAAETTAVCCATRRPISLPEISQVWSLVRWTERRYGAVEEARRAYGGARP
ncbi:hypothetical protein [Streptomyces sp. NPDC047928]|uniref:hypothetical protein n=1 Tax=unclassified Streptomyces TaxID=2593676 RepID=UPI0037166CFE